MAEGFQNLNTTVTIKSKASGASDIVLTGEISNFIESGIERRVNYTKLVGGRVIPSLVNPLSYLVSFDFILVNGKLLDIAKDDWYFDMSNDDNNKYMVQLNFSNSASEVFTKRYYDAYITIFKIESKDEVLQGKIEFTLPSISIDGNKTIYNGDVLATAETYDNTMGY